jgi:hypothetical protein
MFHSSSGFRINGGTFYNVTGDMNLQSNLPLVHQQALGRSTLPRDLDGGRRPGLEEADMTDQHLPESRLIARGVFRSPLTPSSI